MPTPRPLPLSRPPLLPLSRPPLLPVSTAGRRRWLHGMTVIAAGWFGGPSRLARAQAYPWKPLRIVVPWAPGGLVDTGGRVVAEALTRAFGQPAPVENVPGAAGTLGAGQVAKAPGDGHTLLMGTSSVAIDVAGERRLSYDPRRDLLAAALIAETPSIVIVPVASPIRTLEQLIAAGRSRPDALSYGTPGIGSPAHLFTELFAQTAGIRMLHVPYGRTAAITDLIGERLSMMVATAPAALPQIRNGLVRPLAVTSGSRLSALPELPTVREAGLSGYEASQWLGVFAPAGTPDATVQRINTVLTSAVTGTDVTAVLRNRGLEPRTATPDAFARLFTEEIDKWARVMRAGAIRLE